MGHNVWDQKSIDHVVSDCTLILLVWGFIIDEYSRAFLFSIRLTLFSASTTLLQLFFLSHHGARENQVQLAIVLSGGDLLCCFD
jgi:hypothetical protein